MLTSVLFKLIFLPCCSLSKLLLPDVMVGIAEGEIGVGGGDGGSADGDCGCVDGDCSSV